LHFIRYDDEANTNLAILYVCKISDATELTLACDYLHADVSQFDWAMHDEKDTVYLISKSEGFVRIDDPTETDSKKKAENHHELVPLAESFEESTDGSFVFVTTKQDDTTFHQRTLYISKDRAQTFAIGTFPLKGRHVNFAVVDSSNGMAMVCVETYKTRFEGTALLEVKTTDGGKKNISAYRAAFTEAPKIPEGTLMFYDKDHNEGCDWTHLKPSDIANFRNRIVVVRRGTCKFHEKAMLAQQMGAKALVVINSDDSFRLYMSAPDDAFEMPDIPVIIIGKNEGDAIVDEWLKTGFAGKDFTLRPMEVEAVETSMWKSTNLYTSDETGARFSLSLSAVNYEGAGYFSSSFVDVFKVESTPGTYLANFRDTQQVHEQGEDDHETIVTVITNNHGAHWRRLKSPENARDQDRRPLHISLESSRAAHYIPLPQSTASAAGIIIANGWEDDHIPVGQEATDMARTYVSRDAGTTWRMLEIEEGLREQDEYAPFKGYHDYRILDHGSIIIFIPRKSSHHIGFSVDEGHGDVLTYNLNKMGNSEAMIYDGIVTEPGSTTTKAYLYEHRSTTGIPSDNQWFGDVIDFAPLLGSKCKDSDYIDTPFTPNPNTECVLGAKQVYKRRKDCSIAPCLNSLEFELVNTNVQNCKCSQYDYKCAYGFVRKPKVDDSGFDFNNVDCTRDFDAPCDLLEGETSTFNLYEKLPHDTCTSGAHDAKWTQTYQEVSCKKQAVGVGTGLGDAIGYLMVAAILLGLSAALILTVSESARKKTMSYLGTEEGCLGSLGDWLSSFECFQQMAQAQVYNELSISAEPLVNEEEDSTDDEEDNILFGLDDKDIEGANDI
jgi:hypothetical protein